MKTVNRLLKDKYLTPFRTNMRKRRSRMMRIEKRLTSKVVSLQDFAAGHHYFGLHRNSEGGWTFREWAPNAKKIFIIGDMNNWKEQKEYRLTSLKNGKWEINLPADAIAHEQKFKLKIYWKGGEGERIPAYARRVVQDQKTHIFSAQVWEPEESYAWQTNIFHQRVTNPLIYEAHVGMAQEGEGVGTWNEFAEKVLPRVVENGYNILQLMAVMEHPYYGSFGYHVSNFFAASSRFGTPEELKALIDKAHAAGLIVIMDVVHSHAVSNHDDGLACFDGTQSQYFHEGDRGVHEAWDSLCFDYGKIDVLHFLLSNCHFWLEEYRFDGFRFDGVTSMLYHDHGLGKHFLSYHDYFDENVDECAYTYLALANKLIHEVNPMAITIAEDVSGMPGIGAPQQSSGLGFDYTLAMGIADFWFTLLEDYSDEEWNMDNLWYQLTNYRDDEKCISYVECHDQSIVGGKSLIFQLVDSEIYYAMDVSSQNDVINRGIALHKMIRLITLATARDGYLNFIGNEFGHPEWVDFPRRENNWSYKFAQRKWSLCDDKELRFQHLNKFDQDIITLFKESKMLSKYFPTLSYVHCDDHIIAFERGDYMFIFNFHPMESKVDYPIDLQKSSTYRLVLNSTSEIYGGENQIEPEQVFHPLNLDESRVAIKVYIPARSCMVLKRDVKLK